MSGDLAERFPGVKHSATDRSPMMSAPTTTLHAGKTSAQWRVLNALFYAGTGGINVSTLCNQQQVDWDALVALDTSGHLAASMGKVSIPLASLTGAPNSAVAVATRLRLAPAGDRLVTTNPANQVICCLGGRARQSARVRDVKAEGMADDDLLRRMEAAYLVNVTYGGTPMPLSAFRRVPPQLLVHLSAKGRRYFPNGGAG